MGLRIELSRRRIKSKDGICLSVGVVLVYVWVCVQRGAESFGGGSDRFDDFGYQYWWCGPVILEVEFVAGVVCACCGYHNGELFGSSILYLIPLTLIPKLYTLSPRLLTLNRQP